MHIGKQNPKTEYNLGGQIISKVNNIRDLGVIISDNLTFDQHIRTIVKSANLTANMLLRNFYNKKPSFLINMFNTYVRSKLEYASQLWNPTKISLISLLEKVQRRFTKRIPLLKNSTYQNRLTFLKTTSLEERRMHLDLIFIFKLFKGFYDIPYTKFFQLNDRNSRKHQWAIYKHHCNKDLPNSSFLYRIVNVWNGLPSEVVEVNTVAQFKSKLKTINLARYLRGDVHGV